MHRRRRRTARLIRPSCGCNRCPSTATGCWRARDDCFAWRPRAGWLVHDPAIEDKVAKAIGYTGDASDLGRETSASTDSSGSVSIVVTDRHARQAVAIANGYAPELKTALAQNATTTRQQAIA